VPVMQSAATLRKKEEGRRKYFSLPSSFFRLPVTASLQAAMLVEASQVASGSAERTASTLKLDPCRVQGSRAGSQPLPPFGPSERTSGLTADAKAQPGKERIVPPPLPTRKLPASPDLEQLKRQAKELLKAFRAGEKSAVADVRRFYHDANAATFALHDAQLVLARSYGYDSWPKLKAYVDGVTVKRLITATRANDLEQVKAILRVRPELVNTVEAWNYEYAALHYAVLDRMSEMVRVLMRFGADPHAGIYPQTDATSPLTIARERGYDEIVAIIRDEEKRREAGRPTADDLPAELRRTLQTGDEDRAIAILRQHPALVHFEAPENRRTLLHVASASLLRRVAALLLDLGANVNARARDGAMPLDVAGMMCQASDKAPRIADLARLLREHGAEMTPRAAVIAGDEEYLRTRHVEGTLISPQDDQGWLLRLAVDCDRPEMLKLLLDFGLDPDARARVTGVDEIAFTWGMPLYRCARTGKYAMAEMLLERSADPNAQVYASGTPLSEAYGQRDEKMIALLERYGGKSNPSMAGLYRRKDLALRLLAEHGDVALPDDGFSSGPVAEQLVGAAARGGDPEILRVALDRVEWPKGDPRWYGALTQPLGFWNHWYGPWCHHEWDRTTYLTCFKMILERCGPPTARLRFGTTLLHQVVAMGEHVTADERAAFATTALDAGARMDLRDDLLKSTPLGWAARWGRGELVRVFLERGADPVEADAEPWATPLAWAEQKGHAHLVALLREHSR
jgi:ankyrin repeat protein